MSYRVLSHTADTGIEAAADSFAALLGDLLTGMFALMAEIEGVEAQRWVDTTVESTTAGDLVVDALSEALYLSEVEDMTLCEFQVDATETWTATVRMGGVPRGTTDATGPAVKAVTYHQLVVEEREDGWHATVYFDV